MGNYRIASWVILSSPEGNINLGSVAGWTPVTQRLGLGIARPMVSGLLSAGSGLGICSRGTLVWRVSGVVFVFWVLLGNQLSKLRGGMDCTIYYALNISRLRWGNLECGGAWVSS